MADLAHVLRQLPHIPDPNLIVGQHFADDAAVYRISPNLALVQTVDFFTPIVDDPYTYGLIAAANSLSDVYAMGGKPLTALNIVGFPVKTLSLDILREILRGGADKAGEAGVPIVGGHTVDDDEPKYGFSVTGTIHPDRVITAHGARPGDLLVLTKPLGTGTVATALKAGAASPHHVAQAVRWMTRLNRTASEAMIQAGAHAATDVTGYGLLGHLTEMCSASEVGARVDMGKTPFLPGAYEYVRDGFQPGGTATNLKAVEDVVDFDASVTDVDVGMMTDPQTSGGLLVALPPEKLSAFLHAGDETMLAAVLGEVTEGRAGTVRVVA
jgi:selenide,water dikinase